MCFSEFGQNFSKFEVFLTLEKPLKNRVLRFESEILTYSKNGAIKLKIIVFLI